MLHIYRLNNYDFPLLQNLLLLRLTEIIEFFSWEFSPLGTLARLSFLFALFNNSEKHIFEEVAALSIDVKILMVFP